MKAPRRKPKLDAWKAAEAYGCDMASLEHTLSLTVAQRIQAHRSALALAERLQEAAKRSKARKRKRKQR